MDENLKYYKVTGPGIEQDVVLGIKPEQVDETMRRYGERGYTLEETEAPKGAHIVEARPHMPNIDPFLEEYRNYAVYEPYMNVRYSAYDSPTCARCKNRYKRSDFCDRHCADKNCYRFKLER
jgi:hypothetical protein